MKSNFEEKVIAGIKFKNSIIRSGTHEGMADEDGRPTESLKELYIKLAKGGVGGIITGYSGVDLKGKSDNLNMLMIDKDELVESYRELVEEVHKYDTPIILQISHCGKQTSKKATKYTPVAPSAIKDKVYKDDLPKELSEIEIYEIINSFSKASKRAEEAKFDGIQIQVSHGYLLSSFLSKYSNKRNDKWGGSLENRYRIIDHIIRKIKKEQPGFPVFVKLNAYDNRKNGMRIEEAIEVAKLLEESGCDAIEVSCGVVEDGLNMSRGKKVPTDAILKYNINYNSLSNCSKSILKHIIPFAIKNYDSSENYNVDAAIKIKEKVNIPVIVVGGIKNKQSINEILNIKKIDMLSMSRPLILEPSLINKFKENKQDEAKCIGCNYCLMAVQTQKLRCYYGKTN